MDLQLTFTVSLKEANLALSYLGKAPYEQVASLIDKMKAQAQVQIDQAEKADQMRANAQEDR